MKVNEGTEDEFTAHGYHRNNLRTILFWLLCIITGGIVWIVLRWYPEKRARFVNDPCSLSEAHCVTIYALDGQKYVEEVKEVSVPLAEDQSTVHFESDILKDLKMRYFVHMFLRYRICCDDTVHEITGHDQMLSKSKIDELASQGVSPTTTNFRKAIHGSNHIEVPVRSFFVYCAQEAANPFYVFQVFSFTLWFIEGYIYYPCVIILISLTSIVATAYQTLKQMQKLHKMVGQPCNVQCLNNVGEQVTKCSIDLVPGDILLIPNDGMDMPCDSILLEGACVVNESSLTGESFPVSKKSFEMETDVTYHLEEHKLYTLQYGTHVLQARSSGRYVRSLVVRTNFCTLKGRLIRRIIHPKALKFQAYREAFRFLGFLGFLGIIGMIFSFVVLGRQGQITIGELVVNSLDVITIIVPPGLPACLSVGIIFALNKLKAHDIFCIDSQRINMCGDLNLFVFDKTGTLTEDHLEVKGVYQKEDEELVNVRKGDQNENNLLIRGMACCHSLHHQDGHVTGNPVDTGMFDFSKWSMKETSSESDFLQSMESPSTNQTITILKEFPFESSLQRMSVIVNEESKSESQPLRVYMKGSPEMILSFCVSGVDESIFQFLKEETDLGHRVLAMATRTLSSDADVRSLSRVEIESGLHFCGLIVFVNAVKDASASSIATLKDGGVRSVMATGDHLNTAVAVARDVEICRPMQQVYHLKMEKDNLVYSKVKCVTSRESSVQLSVASTESTTVFIERDSPKLYLDYCCALTGDVYNEIKRNHKDLLPNVLLSTSVYARMSPMDKSMLMEDLKEIGYSVGMCGDGANDCGALRAANAGIALSEAEASVAAPFTSKVFDISCVPQLVREGRAALVTSFSIFKYIALYSFIQFFGVLILYNFKTSYSDWGFFMADLILAFAFALAITRSKTSSALAEKGPPGRLSEIKTIVNIFVQLIVLLVFQILAAIFARRDAFYQSPEKMGEIDFGFYYVSYESYAVVSMNFFQYIWTVFPCYTSEPYLEPLYKNRWFIGIFIVNLTLVVLSVLAPADFIRTIFEYPTKISQNLSLIIIGLGLANLFVLLGIDWLVQKMHCLKLCLGKINALLKRRKKKANYKIVFNRLSHENWIEDSIKSE
ncbi:polyamine-transporting ATPase 13A3-like [Clytia hemisphaerica]